MQQGLIEPTLTITPAVLTSDTNGTGVGSADADAVMHSVLIGNSGDTLSSSVYFDLILEESDDNSTFTAVSDADHVVDGANSSFSAASGIFATINDPTEDQIVVSIHYVGSKPYSRVTVDFTGTHTNGTPIAAEAIKSHLRKHP